MTAMLEVKEMITRYGQSQVLHGISLSVERGEVVSLLGRNGVGKTTTFRSIMGLTPPRSGSILLKGAELAGLAPHEIAALGVGYVPDDRRIFADLTAEENLELARPAFWQGVRPIPDSPRRLGRRKSCDRRGHTRPPERRFRGVQGRPVRPP